MGRISNADRFLEREEMGCQRLITDFSGKQWPKTSITRLLQKTDNYGTVKRKSGKHNNNVIVTSQSITVNK